MPFYRITIDQTIQTINRRAKHYRNLIVSISFIGLGVILWAGISRSWLPLVGALLLVPFCGLYLLIDGTLLNRWRQKLLVNWQKGEIDFNALYQAMMAISTLPKNTVESMLATLPISEDLVKEQDIASSTRSAITVVLVMIYACRNDQIIIKTTEYTIIASTIIAAVVFRMWLPFLALFIIVLNNLVQKKITRHRLKDVREKVAIIQSQSDFNLDQFWESIRIIDLTPVSDTQINETLG